MGKTCCWIIRGLGLHPDGQNPKPASAAFMWGPRVGGGSNLSDSGAFGLGRSELDGETGLEEFLNNDEAEGC